MLTLAQIEKITNDCIDTMLPSRRQGVRDWVDEMKKRGCVPYIYFGFRTERQQADLYEAFKNGTGGHAAPPGESYHEFGCAFDWTPIMEMKDTPGLYEADWNNAASYRLGEQIAAQFGLTHISIETGHLQDIRFKSWREARAAFEQSQWPTA